MKVILSRKGFDSANGGYPSPILPDNRLISLPIPCKTDKRKYSDLKLSENETYYDLMKKVNPKIKYDKKWHELSKDTRCHLDPDIYRGITQRENNWKHCFGQINGAQSHLANECVEKGDLFLFFGKFAPFGKSTPKRHIIFGYLQIGEIIQVNNKAHVEDWMQSHPHANDENRKANPTNMIYVASDKLTINESKPGAGVLKFSEKRVLTKKGLSCSKWELPEFFKNVRITHHSKESWKEGYFQSAAIGQEFVIEDNEKVKEWAKKLIE